MFEFLVEWNNAGYLSPAFHWAIAWRLALSCLLMVTIDIAVDAFTRQKDFLPDTYRTFGGLLILLTIIFFITTAITAIFNW